MQSLIGTSPHLHLLPNFDEISHIVLWHEDDHGQILDQMRSDKIFFCVCVEHGQHNF